MPEAPPTTPNAAQTAEAIGHALQALTDKARGWANDLLLMLPNLVVATLVLILFGLAARYGGMALQRVLRRMTPNHQVVDLVSTLARLGIVTVGVFVALGILRLDKTVTSLLAGVGVIGLALSFAFQDLAANLVSGVILSIRNPFRVGDFVRSNDVFGRIEAVHLRATHVRQVTGELVVLPNRKILQEAIYNFTHPARHRIDLPVGVSYGSDLDRVLRVTRAAVEALPMRLPDRDVEVFFTGFGASSIDLVARFWIEYGRPADAFAARSAAVLAVKKAYDAHGVTIPFPIRTLDFGIVGGRRLDEVLRDRRRGVEEAVESDTEPG